ncbi:hypothetical protein D3C86_1874010 [compost metagenome]
MVHGGPWDCLEGEIGLELTVALHPEIFQLSEHAKGFEDVDDWIEVLCLRHFASPTMGGVTHAGNV